jgi:FdhD protein
MSRLRRPGPSTRVRVHETRSVPGQQEPEVRRHEDRLATEEPLEIRLAWPGRPAHRVAVTMRTPGHDFELATGFLHAEGVLASAEDVRTVAYCTDVTLTAEQEFNVVTVELGRPPRRLPPERYGGLTASSSACGVCGTESIDDVLALCEVQASSRWSQLRLDPQVLLGLPGRLRQEQRVFDSTGGLHAAGLFDETGTPSVVREDVGRHNAVDKVVGRALLDERVPLNHSILVVSGRAGYEIVQKSITAGIPVLAAVGAPSSLAVALAREFNQTLVGFLKGDRFNVYSAPERLLQA